MTVAVACAGLTGENSDPVVKDWLWGSPKDVHFLSLC